MIHVAKTTTALSAAPIATAAAASLVALPPLQAVALACLIPTSLGFYKYEYGVSYGYGLSVATVAGLVLQSLRLVDHSTTCWAQWHAIALVAYGLRLSLFLLYRECRLPRFRAQRERIEQARGTKKQPSQLKLTNRIVARTPLVLGCAALYAGMAAPLWVTAQSMAVTTSTASTCGVVAALGKVSVACTWIGFLVAAWGDLQKTYVKAKKGENTLVKGGVFAWLRHPNYTGEAFGWTASFMASVMAAVSSWDSKFIGPLAASFLGWVGIVGVLAMATTGLEKRQREKYETNPDYEKWIRRSWAGPTLPGK